MLLPRGIAQLVADELVGGQLVGDAQQGLGHAHQQHALLGAEVVLAHEGLHQLRIGGADPGALHQGLGRGLHPGLDVSRKAGGGQQLDQVVRLVAGIGRGGAFTRRTGRGGQFRAEDGLHAVTGSGEERPKCARRPEPP